MENEKNNELFEKTAGAVKDAVHEEFGAYESEQDEFTEPEVKKTAITMDGELLLIAPVGRLDTVTSAELKDLIAGYDVADHDVEFDFTNVEYISSAGLRLLVAMQKQTKAGGRTMVIKNINSVVKEVFRVSGFNKAFTVL